MATGQSKPRPAPTRLPSEGIPAPPREPREQVAGAGLHGSPLAGLILLAVVLGVAAVAFRAWEVRFWAAGVCA